MQRSRPGSQPNPKFHELSGQILEFLGRQRGAKAAIDVARHLGHTSKKKANSILYSLEKDQLVTLDTSQGKKPLWRLCGKAAEMAEEMFKDTSKDTSAPGAYSPGKGWVGRKKILLFTLCCSNENSPPPGKASCNRNGR